MIDRGKAFQYGFVTAIFTILFLYLVKEGIEIQVDAYTIFLISMWLPLTTCFIALIVKDAYDGVNSTSGRFVLTILGVSGLFIFTQTIIHIIAGKEMLLDNGVITETAGHIFNGICMITISIVYWIKQHFNKLKFSEEDI